MEDVTISVSFAKYKGRTSLWRIKKNTNSGANPTWDVPVRAAQGQTTIPVEVIGKAALGVNYEANGGDGCSVGESVEGASGLVNTNCPNGGFRKDNTKRIKGHVDDELLWNYSQCLVNLVSEESSSEEIVLKNCFDASPGKNVADSDDTLNVLFMGKEDLSKRGEAEEYMVNSLGERDINGVVKSNVNLVDDIENSNLKSPRNSGSPPMNDISNGGADELGVKSGLSENGVVSSSDKVMEDILATGFNKGDLENEAGPTLELLNKETGEFKSNKQVSWADVVLQNTNSGNTGDSGEGGGES
ncbi:hypothetical protein V6N12_047243 [Hibiscus sabdariffa]|uniref:C2 NT-type domain-containing protein n=1 Tax=Hibiscus sabdariffa TaxID=183260 RepID=A0ABR2DAA7_9ROSI